MRTNDHRNDILNSYTIQNLKYFYLWRSGQQSTDFYDIPKLNTIGRVDYFKGNALDNDSQMTA